MTATVERGHDDPPDMHLVESVLWGRQKHRTMRHRDFVHVVRELTERGESADLIADRLGCSTRLVKRARVEIWGRGGVGDAQSEQRQHQRRGR